MSRCPIFVIPPSRWRPPVEDSRGVIPTHAAKSRPLRKLSIGGANACTAIAVSSPTPGIVIRRPSASSSLTMCRISRSKYPHLPFERYADDAIVHCRTKREAEEVREAIAARLTDCRLELHPEKTQIVYCKDDNRRGNYPIEKFDFLGYTFRPRRSKNHRGKYFISFTPAVSNKAARAIRAKIRSWHLPVRSDKSIEDLSRMFNPIVRGWLQYYGQYYRSAMYPSMRHMDRALTRWASRKYKKLRRHRRRAAHWIARISRRDPRLFAHWQMGVRRGSMVGAV